MPVNKNFHILFIFLTIVFYSFCTNKLFAQQINFDTTYINLFEKTNVIEAGPGLSFKQFNFTNPDDHKKDFQLVAGRSIYNANYLNYKWVSLSYSWAMPGTFLENNIKLQYTSLRFTFGGRQMKFRPFYDSYNGLLIPLQKRDHNFDVFRGIQFTDAGMDYYFYSNPGKFSINAANSFSEQQKKNSGSVFFMITPMWQKIKWNSPSRDLVSDSLTFDLLSSCPQWVSLIGRIGYIYNLSFSKGKWDIIPSLIAGPGFLREINTSAKKFQIVYDIQASLKGGFNGANCYFYISAFWNYMQTNLFIQNLDQVRTNFSFTAGFRFRNLKKKVLGIL